MSGDELRFSLLGPVTAWRGGEELPLGSPQQRLVLAVLLLAGGRMVALDQVVDAVWGQRLPPAAARTARTYLSRLRAVLGADVITGRGDGYALAAGASDVRDFEVHRTAGRTRAALDLFRGEPLAGLAGDYAQAQRARLAEERLALRERWLEAEIQAGRHTEVVPELIGVRAEHPLRESVSGLLMLALSRGGQQAAAIEVFTELRKRLADELGVDPSPALAAVYQRVITGEAPAVTRRGPAQLPADVADFTGRKSLVDALAAALEPGGALAISAVNGIGGVGKTALAVHVGHRVRERFPDGQLYVDLRGAGRDPVEPVTVLGQFLRALGVDGPPDELAQRSALFRSTLSDRRVLLLLDNAADAAQVRPLLPGASGCAVVVTSRARIPELDGARQVGLDVLDPLEALALLGAIAGGDRIGAERPAAMDLVAACGFLPLAIRIIGARLVARPAWSVASLRDRLVRRRLSELKGVQAAFSLGYEQITAPQARAFRLLARADVPDLALPAARAMIGQDAEDLCESLVDLNLLESPSPGRYRYHDLLKAYARGLDDDESEAALARLADFTLATTRNAHFAISEDEALLDAIRPTRAGGLAFASGREAMDWMLTEALGLHSLIHQFAAIDADLAADVLCCVYELSSSGYHSALYAAASRAVARAANAQGAARAEGRGLACITQVLIQGARHAEARPDAERAIELLRSARDTYTLPFALSSLILIVNVEGDVEQELALHDESLASFREVGDVLGEAAQLSALATRLVELGQVEQAVEMSATSVRLLREFGNTQRLTFALYHNGYVLQQVGRLEEALEAHRQAVRGFEESRSAIWVGRTLWLMARSYRELDRLEESLRAGQESLAVLSEIGYESGIERARQEIDETRRRIAGAGAAQVRPA